MSIQDTIAQDLMDIAAAQTALDSANAKLAADQDRLASIQPHLQLIDQIESALAQVEMDVDAVTHAALDSIKGAVQPFLDQMRALFLNQ